MGSRWFALALCAIPALAANICDGLPASPPKDAEYADLFPAAARPAAFGVSVKPGGPAFRITVLPAPADSFANGRDEMGHAGDIEVASCQSGKRLPLLPFMASQPLNFGPTFHAADINFEGYLDFYLLTEYAAGWMRKSYWVYDPAAGLFVQNELTRELGANCLGEQWHGACHADIEFDPEKREIGAYYLKGCPGDTKEGDRYRIANNRLVIVHKEEVTERGQAIMPLRPRASMKRRSSALSASQCPRTPMRRIFR